MLKMSVSNHLAASYNITNSMDRNITCNHPFYFIELHPLGPVGYATAPLDLSTAKNDIFDKRQWYERMKAVRRFWFETK